MNEPLVSVIIPVYNSADFIGETLRSVLDQNYANLEVLCLDDCSTDASLEVLQQAAAADSRVHVLASRPNKGQSAMRNLGLRKARGEYVAFLDSDDLAMPDRIASQLAFMREHPELDFTGCYAEYFGKDSGADHRSLTHDEIRITLLFWGCPFNASTVFMRKVLFDKYGILYNENLRFNEDTEFYGRLLPYARMANLPETLVKTRLHAQSTSHRHRLQDVEIADLWLLLVTREFHLSAAEQNAMAVFFRKEPANGENIRNIDLVITSYLENTPAKYRKMVITKLFRRISRLYLQTPELSAKHLKPFLKAAFKYKGGYGLAFKTLFKKL